MTRKKKVYEKTETIAKIISQNVLKFDDIDLNSSESDDLLKKILRALKLQENGVNRRIIRDTWKSNINNVQKAVKNLQNEKECNKNNAVKIEENITEVSDFPTDSIDQNVQEILSVQEAECNNSDLKPNDFKKIEANLEFTVTDNLVGYYFRGSYHPVNENSFIALEIENFMTLRNNEFIDGEVVDAFGIIKEKNWPNSFAIPSGITSFIIGDYGQTENGDLQFFKNLNYFYGKLMMPYYSGKHWCLFVLDFSNNKAIHLDPIKIPEEIYNTRTNLVLKRFENFMNSSHSNFEVEKHKFELENFVPSRPFQTDGCNCACYVMYFMDCIATNTSMDVNFNAFEYRNHVTDLLLKNKEDFNEIMKKLDYNKTLKNISDSQNIDSKLTCSFQLPRTQDEADNKLSYDLYSFNYNKYNSSSNSDSDFNLFKNEPYNDKSENIEEFLQTLESQTNAENFVNSENAYLIEFDEFHEKSEKSSVGEDDSCHEIPNLEKNNIEDDAHKTGEALKNILDNKNNTTISDYYVDTLMNRHFKIQICEYRISMHELQCNDDKWLNDSLREALRKILKMESKYRTCVLHFYGGIHYPKDSIVLYARCRYSSHKQSFRFVITVNEPGFYDIYITSKEDCEEVTHEGPKIIPILNGKKRQDVSEALKNIAPRDYQFKLIKKVDREIFGEGDVQNYENLNKLQKIRSQENCKNDSGMLRSSHLNEIYQKVIDDQKLKDPYLRHISIPFTVAMFSLKQLNILKKDDDIAGFDATGNIAYRPNDVHCKRILYYPIVINKNGRVIPIAELVSSMHDTTTISIFLKQFRAFVINEGFHFPLFKIVTTDWSWPLMNALLIEWNHMSAIEYLNLIYDCLMKGVPLPTNIIVIHHCISHFIHRIAKTMKTRFTNTSKKLILECMGVLIKCQTMMEMEQGFENLAHILLAKTQEDANKHISDLNTLQENLSKDSQDHSSEADNEEEKYSLFFEELSEESKSHEGDTIFSQSPFFKNYNFKSELIKQAYDKQPDPPNEAENKHRNPELLEYIVKTYMAYACMWSGLVLNLVKPSIKTLSNAISEVHFKNLKVNMMKNLPASSVGRFTDKTRNYVAHLCKQADLIEILNEGKAIKPKNFQEKKIIDKTCNVPNNECATEGWSKKVNEKNRVSYLKGSGIKKVAMNRKKKEQNEDEKAELKDFSKISRKRKASDDVSSNKIKKNKIVLTEEKHEILSSEDNLSEEVFSDYHSNFDSDEILTLSDDDASQSNKNVTEDIQALSFNDHNLESYIRYKKVVFTIGKFSLKQEHLLNLGTCKLNLFHEQFQTLKGFTWINADVIDAFIIANENKWSNVECVPSGLTNTIIGDTKKEPIKKLNLFKNLQSYKGKILMPYCYKSHWHLLIIDQSTKQISHLDPLFEKNKHKEERAFNVIKNYIKKCREIFNLQIDENDYKLVNIQQERPKQTDGYNCGVYIMFYMNCIGTNSLETHDDFDPNLYRSTITNLLIKSSENMDQVCLHCFSDRRRAFVTCLNCAKIVHNYCLTKYYPNKFIKKWTKGLEEFFCILCFYRKKSETDF